MGRMKNIIDKSEMMHGKIPRGYDLSFSQIIELIDTYTGSVELTAAAFRLGYMQGTKAECARRKEKVVS